MVHRLGYRFRLHGRDLPGKPDLVFPSRLKVVFVHGCFWHQHRSQHCKIIRMPKSNVEYWQRKLTYNVNRDCENRKKLAALGWKVLVVWECSVKNSKRLEARLKRFLRVTAVVLPSATEF
jgi:DNA mismatch endonuclease (patch repair protein)